MHAMAISDPLSTPQYTLDEEPIELEAFIEGRWETFDAGDLWEICQMSVGEALIFDDGTGGELVVRRVR